MWENMLMDTLLIIPREGITVDKLEDKVFDESLCIMAKEGWYPVGPLSQTMMAITDPIDNVRKKVILITKYKLKFEA